MAGLEVTPTAFRDSTRTLLEKLPSWLKDEIRADRLLVCDRDCAGGENPPAGCDVLVAYNVPRSDRGPWGVLQALGSQVARHLVVPVPFGGRRDAPDDLYTFDDATIATRIEPDFRLSSCKAIGGEAGRGILLVYSRGDYFPDSPVFEGKAEESAAGSPPAAGPGGEALSGELGKTAALLESREAELRETSRREAALRSDIGFWKNRAAAFERQLEQQAGRAKELQGEAKRLREEVARLGAIQKDNTAEMQLLSSAADARSIEAAHLRRLVTELQTSLSWKITTPLRAVSKPLFRMLARNTVPPAAPREVPRPAAAGASSPAPVPAAADPIESIILPELRRARSIAVIQCAIPFSSALNQRPISYARYLADHGYTVLFAEVWRCPEADVHRAGEEVYPGVFSIPFYPFQNDIVHTFQDNIDRIAAASVAPGLYFCTLPASGLADVVRPLRAAGYHIHYDIMDDWEEFHRGGEAHWYSGELERALLTLSDSVTAVSEGLARKFAGLRPDVAVVRNGYAPSALCCEQFIAARSPVEFPRVVGYFGHFSDAWFDWDTVFHTAQQRPDLRFELIGYGLSEQARIRMSGFPNIRFEGLVPQNNLHRYARKWWAGMIPFRPSVVSLAVDPLKIYEYLHFGLPTVVTGISGIADYPMVSYAENRDAFVAALDRLPDRPDAASLAEVAEFLKPCVWEERLARLNQIAGLGK